VYFWKRRGFAHEWHELHEKYRGFQIMDAAIGGNDRGREGGINFKVQSSKFKEMPNSNDQEL
jgi:hypothetical protein